MASSAGAHLRCMNTTGTTIAAAQHDDNVVRGAFEASYSLKDLVAELQVSEQTIYDLRTRAAAESGSGSVAACDSADPNGSESGRWSRVFLGSSGTSRRRPSVVMGNASGWTMRSDSAGESGRKRCRGHVPPTYGLSTERGFRSNSSSTPRRCGCVPTPMLSRPTRRGSSLAYAWTCSPGRTGPERRPAALTRRA